MSELLIIVPSRGRPQSVARLAVAWRDTGAYGNADLLFAVDADDPQRFAYLDHNLDAAGTPARFVTLPTWKPMVRKLNIVACGMADEYAAVGFAGDDHLPRTAGWAGRYLEVLRELGTGIVYGDDGYQGANLPTQWAMTADIVRALGRMVPAEVEHLYCDNAVKDLGEAADCLRYLPDVLIEHMHPAAGKATNDAGYRKVNSREQFRRDRAAYQTWQRSRMAEDAAAVRALRQEAETHA